MVHEVPVLRGQNRSLISLDDTSLDVLVVSLFGRLVGRSGAV